MAINDSGGLADAPCNDALPNRHRGHHPQGKARQHLPFEQTARSLRHRSSGRVGHPRPHAPRRAQGAMALPPATRCPPGCDRRRCPGPAGFGCLHQRRRGARRARWPGQHRRRAAGACGLLPRWRRCCRSLPTGLRVRLKLRTARDLLLVVVAHHATSLRQACTDLGQLALQRPHHAGKAVMDGKAVRQRAGNSIDSAAFGAVGEDEDGLGLRRIAWPPWRWFSRWRRSCADSLLKADSVLVGSAALFQEHVGTGIGTAVACRAGCALGQLAKRWPTAADLISCSHSRAKSTASGCSAQRTAPPVV